MDWLHAVLGLGVVLFVGLAVRYGVEAAGLRVDLEDMKHQRDLARRQYATLRAALRAKAQKKEQA